MPMPKDAVELFDDLMPAALEKHSDKAQEVNAIFYFNITGDGGGQWSVDLTADPPVVNKGDTGNADCRIEVDSNDFQTMLSDPQAGMQLFFQGKLKVEGDPMLATKLQTFFELATE